MNKGISNILGVIIVAVILMGGIGGYMYLKNRQVEPILKTYNLRDVGPAGGLIFYDKGYESDGWRYLEAAPSDQGVAQWDCKEYSTSGANGTAISGANGTAIGTGHQNTHDIIAAGCIISGYEEEILSAAQLCDNLIINGYNDWYIPSFDELNQMYINLKTYNIGGFNDGLYWSSSECGASDAWVQNFGNNDKGYQVNYGKYGINNVRAIRTVTTQIIHKECQNQKCVSVNGIGTNQCQIDTDCVSKYHLRSSGPAGGLIFYDKGSYSEGWRYLEAAPASTEWAAKEWGKYETTIGGTSINIGTGKANTALIVTKLNEAPADSDRAAQLCDALVYNGYSDWFLPSKNELDEIYHQLYLQDAGGFTDNNYWSSSEYNAGSAWRQDFTNGYQYDGYKYATFYVRAVRAF